MPVEVGQKLLGKVTGITHFGAFIELPENQSGLVHISEVSDGFIKDINSVLTVGEEVEVKVLTIAPDGKISLSIRQAVEKEATERTSRQSFKRSAERSSQEPKFRKNFENNKEQTSQNSSMNTTANTNNHSTSDFDQLMSNFLKDSEDRLTSLKRNTEGKRGGRGGRRS